MANTVQSIIRGTLLTVKNPVIAAGGPSCSHRPTDKYHSSHYTDVSTEGGRR